ncbi:DUF732 domain-containing protein [Mycobacterium sp. Lab-001]|uniref:DUF732 domain-containing protein n=1 Tax=Mycobacterium sp. Lab-001 TaxID=3410136 RepID=UPI003D16BAD8
MIEGAERIFRVALISCALATAAFWLAAPAVADESAYIARLNKAQVAHMSQADALHWGYATCNMLRSGATVPEAVTMLEESAGFSNRHAGVVLGAAAAELCPDQYQAVVNWAHDQFEE